MAKRKQTGGAKQEKKKASAFDMAPMASAGKETPRLKVKYRGEILPRMMEHFHYENPMAAPRVSRISLNIGMGEATQNINLLDGAVTELAQIAGQKAVITRARKSIAAFKLRSGMPIGCRVTLRGDRMYEFLDRFISIALPRVRDFRGLSVNSFDGRGNYTVGIREQIIFPEVDYAKVEKVKGMNVTIVTTAATDEEARELLTLFGLPFVKAT